MEQKRWTWGSIIVGLSIGVTLWMLSRSPSADAATPPTPSSLQTVGPSANGAALPDVDEPRTDSHRDVETTRSPEAPSPALPVAAGPTLNGADMRKLRRALGAPGSFQWRELLTTDLLNPQHQEVGEGVLTEVDAAVDRHRSLLSQLAAEAKQTTSEELEALKAAGQTVEIKPGESALKKVGNDAVFTTNLGTGGGIAAKKSNMPRLLEVESRARFAGMDVLRSVAQVLVKHRILDDQGLANLESVLRDWKAGSQGPR